MESNLWVMIPVIGWVFVGVSTLGAGAILLGLYFLRQAIKTHQQVIQNRFENEQIQLLAGNVNCVGQESLSMAQIRGNGCLVLTQSSLFFSMWMPSKEMLIPLSRIREISQVMAFKGKTFFRPLLYVGFENDEGKRDGMAWLVPGVEQWQEALSMVVDRVRDDEQSEPSEI